MLAPVSNTITCDILDYYILTFFHYVIVFSSSFSYNMQILIVELIKNYKELINSNNILFFCELFLI